MSAMTTIRLVRLLAASAVLCGVVTACGTRESGSRPPERQFATPDEAAAALVEAAERFDRPALQAMLGPDGDALVSSEDSVTDHNRAVGFAAQARERMRIEVDSTGTSAVLYVGAFDWPTPMPLVQQKGRWYFDAAAGREEMLRRHIGENELVAIQVCRGYVEAQQEYALTKHDGALVNQYAQRVISTPGKQDGLAWQAANGSWQGPVGEAVARFIADGYTDRYEPFHGYYFKVLSGQGPAAPMGEMDFMVEGAMIGGFALVAAPAEYLVTGVKTFIVSHDGIVYEKDLGEQSLEAFRAMERYNPDSTWKPVQGD
jgi:hypothetical protein